MNATAARWRRRSPHGSAPYSQVRERADEAVIAGRRVRIAARDDLVRMKLAAGRPQDLADVAALTGGGARPVRVTVTMTLAPGGDAAWARELAAERVALFDPNGHVRVDGTALIIAAERADLTGEQAEQWAHALAQRLHAAGTLARPRPDRVSVSEQ